MQKQNLNQEIPETYSGLFLEKYQQAPTLKTDLKLPQLVEKDVLIKVEFAPINPCDQLQQNGFFTNDQSIPPNYIPGMEGSGVVVAAKGEYEETLIGKRVGFLPKEGSGTGSFGQYVISTRGQLVVLPEDVTLQTGACSFINPLTIVSMFKVISERNVKAVVHTAAASQLGKMMVRYFQANGVKVIGVVRKDSQVEALEKEGITAVFNQNSPDFEEKLKESAALHKISAGFDAVQGEMSWKILRNLPPRSNIYIYGLLDGSFTLNNVDAMQFITNNQSISGFSVFPYIATLTEVEVQELISKIGPSLNTHFKTGIAQEISVKDYSEGFEHYFKNMGEGKVLIKQN